MINPDATRRLEAALVGHPHLASRRIRIEADEAGVTLHGVVPSFFHKQLAQEALRRLDGVGRIDNRLEVAWNGVGSLTQA